MSEESHRESHDYSKMTAGELNKLLKKTTDEAVEKQQELSQLIQGSEDPLNPEHIRELDTFTKENLKPLDEKYDKILAALVEISEKSDDEKSDDIIVIDDDDDGNDDGDGDDDNKTGGRRKRRRRRSGRKGKKTRKMRKSKKCGCKKGRKGKKGKKMTRRRRRRRR